MKKFYIVKMFCILGVFLRFLLVYSKELLSTLTFYLSEFIKRLSSMFRKKYVVGKMYFHVFMTVYLFAVTCEGLFPGSSCQIRKIFKIKMSHFNIPFCVLFNGFFKSVHKWFHRLCILNYVSSSKKSKFLKCLW